MKISQEEIDAAIKAWQSCHPANSSADDVTAILEAAYTVRKQRKAAKRERQRKEREAALDQKIRTGSVFGKGSVETWAQARVEVFPPDTTETKEKDKQVLESVSINTNMMPPNYTVGELKAAFGSEAGKWQFQVKDGVVFERVPATPSKAPEWDGTFGVGEWMMRNGEKAIVDQILDGSSNLRGRTLKFHTIVWQSNGSASSSRLLDPYDLIRPWLKPTEGERS